MKAWLLPVVLILAGCATDGAKPAPHVAVAAMGPATSAELEALNKEVIELRKSFASQRDLAQIAAGAVFGAQDANEKNPAGLPREATATQLQEAAKALPAPTDAQKLEKANQNARILAGQLAEVKAEMGQKATEIERLKADKEASDKRADEISDQLTKISAEAAKERAEAAAKLQSQFDAMSKQIDAANARAAQAQQEANNKVTQEQVAALNRAGMGCAGALILTIGLASIFGGIAALQRVAPLAVLLLLGALICFGLAQVIALWWFKWAVLSAVLLVLAYCGWWAAKHYKLGTLQADTQEKADKALAVLKQTVPTLDAAYNKADAAVKAFMDEHIFGVLNEKMDAKDKATVHELRANLTNP